MDDLSDMPLDDEEEFVDLSELQAELKVEGLFSGPVQSKAEKRYEEEAKP